MQSQQKVEEFGFAPSFSCYSSDNTTSTAIAKVIHEQQLAPIFHENEDFEFSLSDEDVSVKDTNSQLGWTVFPVFNRQLLENEIDDASLAIRGPMRKLFIGERDDSSSYSSSESESPRDIISKCKKSRSKRWIFGYLLGRSNSDSSKQKRNSGERLKAQSPVHEQFYVQRRAENEATKRKSYLPYRKELVGFFAM